MILSNVHICENFGRRFNSSSPLKSYILLNGNQMIFKITKKIKQ